MNTVGRCAGPLARHALGSHISAQAPVADFDLSLPRGIVGDQGKSCVYRNFCYDQDWSAVATGASMSPRGRLWATEEL